MNHLSLACRETIRGFHAGLCLSWGLLAGLMLSSQRSTVGVGGGISSWTYLLNQARMVSHYLLLSVLGGRSA